MALARRRRSRPRLTPELDDAALGQLCRRLSERGFGSSVSIAVAGIEQLLDSTGEDWDRRCHRLAVLSEAALPGVQRQWKERRPDHPDALILYAWGVMTRGGLTTPTREETEAARCACAEASRLRPADPCPWIVRLGLLRLWRRPGDELFPLWWEISDRDPWNREAHLQVFAYQSPRECGSLAQLMEFVDAVRAGAPPAAPTAALPLRSLVERYHSVLSRGGVGALSAVRLWDTPEAVQVLRTATTTWPSPGHLTHAAALADLNVLAYALTEAKRSAWAADVFDALDGRVTPFPWNRDGGDPVRAFATAQSKTARNKTGRNTTWGQA
ncbi:hypothetical protein [Streptomyces shenzhenensis]|uniref:hypothetical protein n=1 Tax=Streptomyces shenzhenensis TaxID=943815 RepID=UPI0015F116A2|nr:hypothetical protein [Streptomyces shenzhenensis]